MMLLYGFCVSRQKILIKISNINIDVFFTLSFTLFLLRLSISVFVLFFKGSLQTVFHKPQQADFRLDRVEVETQKSGCKCKQFLQTRCGHWFIAKTIRKIKLKPVVNKQGQCLWGKARHYLNMCLKAETIAVGLVGVTKMFSNSMGFLGLLFSIVQNVLVFFRN